MDSEEQALEAEQQRFFASRHRPAASLSGISSGKPSRFRRQQAAAQQEVDNRHHEPIPGDRVELNVSSASADADGAARRTISQAALTGGVIGVIQEHDSDDDETPHVVVAPDHKTVPRPTKIDWRAKRGAASTKPASSREAVTAYPAEAEAPSRQPTGLKADIDRENTAKLAGMAPHEIATERSELMSSLSPELRDILLKRLKRATLDDQSQVPGSMPEHAANSDAVAADDDDAELAEIYTEDWVRPPVIEAKGVAPRLDSRPAVVPSAVDRSTGPTDTPAGAAVAAEHIHDASCMRSNKASIHFPRGPQAELDPSSATFLDDLKNKYFPDLPNDPSSLSWMRAPSQAEDEASYHPSTELIDPSELRFDFKGELVAPRTSRELDSRIGLHHHADAPLAAGYTLPELAHLSRSAMPAQAAIAIQTAGRVLYRARSDGFGADISRSLRTLAEKTKIEQTFLERTNDRHLGVRSLATEALWLLHNAAESTVRQFEV